MPNTEVKPGQIGGGLFIPTYYTRKLFIKYTPFYLEVSFIISNFATSLHTPGVSVVYRSTRLKGELGVGLHNLLNSLLRNIV